MVGQEGCQNDKPADIWSQRGKVRKKKKKPVHEDQKGPTHGFASVKKEREIRLSKQGGNKGKFLTVPGRGDFPIRGKGYRSNQVAQRCRLLNFLP